MTRYVLRAMTLEDAHKQGFSTKWFDERALSREHLVNEMTDTVDHCLDSRDATHAVLEGFVSWPTQDGP